MVFDLFIIGGGVNGTAIARDAAGRGLKVFLAEQGDLASGTSSASTKLIHGGLRYLEYYDFKLVREALMEREILLNAAPHIIWPLRFILPHHQGLRPRWLIRLGLFLYDHLGGRKILPATRSVNFATDETGKALKPEFTHGWEYSDCWVQDARLVVLNAMDAREKGAEIRTQTRVVSAKRVDSSWEVSLASGETITAKILLNAAGPWVSETLTNIVRQNETAKTRLVKGSHIVVSKLYDHDRAYIFQNGDGRICFAIPYETNFTLIGTTDVDHHEAPGPVSITDEEIDYLLNSVSEYFNRPVSKSQVKWSYAGIRPLYDDGASDAKQATREYVLKLEGEPGQAPMLSVFGGKITTSRKLAESALEKLSPFLAHAKQPWTAKSYLPGGMDYFKAADYLATMKKRFSFLKPQIIERMFKAYGTRMELILKDARFASDLGKFIGPVSESEIQYLIQNEWVASADDILWRRSKLGLHMKPDEIAELQDYFVLKPKPKKAKKG